MLCSFIREGLKHLLLRLFWDALQFFSTLWMGSFFYYFSSLVGYYRDIDKTFKIDNSTKDIVLRIFNLYLEGKSYQTIANMFNEEKILFPDLRIRYSLIFLCVWKKNKYPNKEHWENVCLNFPFKMYVRTKYTSNCIKYYYFSNDF